MARIRHASQPVGKILRELQDKRMQSDGDTRGEVDLLRLSWAIGAAAARIPWRSDCLLQAMAADRWLRRCGMQPEFSVNRLGFMSIPLTGDRFSPFLEELQGLRSPGASGWEIFLNASTASAPCL